MLFKKNLLIQSFILSLTLLIPLTTHALTWIGNVETRPTTNEGVWTINKRQFTINNASQLLTTTGNLNVGTCTRVEYAVDSTGQNIAYSLESVNAAQNPECAQTTTPTTPNTTANCISIASNITYANGNYSTGDVQQIFARDTEGQLREFWRSRNNPSWKLENLSKNTGSTTTVVGNPTFQRGFYNDNDTQQVFVRDANDNLREFWWIPTRGWTLENLTTQTRGPRILGNPVFQRQDRLQQVFTVDNDQFLREFWWTPERGWTIENISQQTGNIKIRSDISFMRGGYYSEGGYRQQYLNNTQQIFAIDTDANLREWSWNIENGWASKVLSRDLKLAGDPVFFPILNRKSNGIRDLVFVRNEAGDLLMFERIKTSNAFTIIQDWQVTNISQKIAQNLGQNVTNIPITGNFYPIEENYFINYPLLTVVMRIFTHDSNGQLVEFRETTLIDTTTLFGSINITTVNWERFNISALAGDTKINGNPVYTKADNTEYLFARNSTGQLLEFWRQQDNRNPLGGTNATWQVINVNNIVCR